jgi:hypothetical protein
MFQQFSNNFRGGHWQAPTQKAWPGWKAACRALEEYELMIVKL